jgi:hypothetical protein
MAVISTQNLFNSFLAKFSIGTNSTAKFTAAFLGAYNDALMDLYNARSIETEPVLLTTLASASTLTERYLPIIKVGIRHHLQSEGEWVKGDQRDEYSALNWKNAIGDAANLLVHAEESSETYTGPWGEQ